MRKAFWQADNHSPLESKLFMHRRQLGFIVVVNAFISAVIAIVVVWVAELRRPDLEELAARYTPPPPVLLVATNTVETIQGEGVLPTPTSAPAPAATATSPPATSSGEDEIYVVEPGDSLFGIAIRFGITVDELLAANDLDDPDFVFSGQRLRIPQPGSGSSQSGSQNVSANVADGLVLRVEQPGNLSEEQIAIINESNAAVNLQGWTLGGGIDDPLYVFGDLPIFPGGSVRVHSGGGTDDSLNRFWNLQEALWSSGELVRLFDQNGTEVVSIRVP